MTTYNHRKKARKFFMLVSITLKQERVIYFSFFFKQKFQLQFNNNLFISNHLYAHTVSNKSVLVKKRYVFLRLQVILFHGNMQLVIWLIYHKWKDFVCVCCVSIRLMWQCTCVWFPCTFRICALDATIFFVTFQSQKWKHSYEPIIHT